MHAKNVANATVSFAIIFNDNLICDRLVSRRICDSLCVSLIMKDETMTLLEHRTASVRAVASCNKHDNLGFSRSRYFHE